MSGLFGTPAGSTNPAQGTLGKDGALNDPPQDSISALSFSSHESANDFLAVASWDNKVWIHEITPSGENRRLGSFDHQGPVLSTCWSKDGTKCFGAGTDKAARMFDLASGTTTQVAQHDAPIRHIQFVEVGSQQLLVTGSWDKTVKYWDCRTPNPIGTLQCADRIYAMDCKDKLLVVGLADRYIGMVNLAQDPTKFYKHMQSPLKWQTRCVSCFSDATGFAVGSIEGRCAIQYVEEKDSAANFSFKCHRINPPSQRDVTHVYSVNSINFHPVHGTFSTAGSDGTFHFWDKDAKHRLKGYPEVGQTISATAFNRAGTIFAYAMSYDWSKGYAHHTPQSINKVMLHEVLPDECKPKVGPKKR